MEVLLVINTQKSFLHQNGSVYIGDEASVLKIRLKDLISTFVGKRVFCREIHAPGDNFFLCEKTHSITASTDTQIIDELKQYAGEIIEKTRYSAFFNTRLESLLQKEKPSQVVLVGLETHTSVLFTAEELRNRGYEVRVVEPCTFSMDAYLHNFAISLMRNNLGVSVS